MQWVLRDGKEVTLKITPTDKQNAEQRPQEFKEWGVCASDLTFFVAKRNEESAYRRCSG